MKIIKALIGAALFIVALTINGFGQISHQRWDSLLRKHVLTDGRILYAGFRKDQQALDDYLNDLSNNPPSNAWSRNDQLAYWINVYNAFTVRLVLDHYPIKSIKDIGGLFQSTWDIAFIRIGKRTLSLNQVEHDILRKDFNDPRIHFAIVCASKSCPALRQESFDAFKLDAQLDEQTRRFLRDSSKNRFGPDIVELSPIFDWFKSDFERGQSLLTFLSKYTEASFSNSTRIRYTSYDWSLNE